MAYEYPQFVWSAGTGGIDVDARTGLVTFGGGIRFSGHGGALDTTLSNARLELAGTTGYLVFDITGTTQDGAAVAAQNVRFAQFALGDLEVTGGALVLDALPAVLTDAGAAAFGTYAPGDELDPVSATIPVGTGCGVAAAEEESDAVAAPAAETTDALVAAPETAPVWPWFVGAGVLVLAAVAAGILIARRRAGADASE